MMVVTRQVVYLSSAHRLPHKSQRTSQPINQNEFFLHSDYNTGSENQKEQEKIELQTG
jgi:hypothetical protein